MHIKKRELSECARLFPYQNEPDVKRYVRDPSDSADEYLFYTKRLLEDEECGLCISRTVLDDFGQPIGTITLFDIKGGAGFLGTWIGGAFQGKGYNRKAKELFFQEIFLEGRIETVFLRIRKENAKSRRAAEKLPYAVEASRLFPTLYEAINEEAFAYDLFAVTRDCFHLWLARTVLGEEQALSQ